ncbi:hypothetical protein PILCRDRAFT_756784 [Piloderma croceum F 1598]|uniref:Uncharacterized protein n=1 Tax=Piloderma croceum (strain F 1598) TaxID=765440 RepID=A0A0C3EU37_PILCF|nr:hypothetical protein PILCRDRAFT_756784 [Piloderma croceum F 1598]
MDILLNAFSHGTALATATTPLTASLLARLTPPLSCSQIRQCTDAKDHNYMACTWCRLGAN